MSDAAAPDEKVDAATLARLPEVLRPVAAACGLAAALTIVQVLGGRKIYVPARPRPGQKLVEAAGMAAATAMARAFASDQIEIPSAALLRREGLAAAILRDNRAHGMVANALGISHSQVKKTRRKHRRRNRQQGAGHRRNAEPTLFD